MLDDIQAQNVPIAAGESVARRATARCVPLPIPIGVAVEDKAALKPGLNDVTQGVVYATRSRNGAALIRRCLGS